MLVCLLQITAECDPLAMANVVLLCFASEPSSICTHISLYFHARRVASLLLSSSYWIRQCFLVHRWNGTGCFHDNIFQVPVVGFVFMSIC